MRVDPPYGNPNKYKPNEKILHKLEYIFADKILLLC